MTKSRNNPRLYVRPVHDPGRKERFCVSGVRDNAAGKKLIDFLEREAQALFENSLRMDDETQAILTAHFYLGQQQEERMPDTPELRVTLADLKAGETGDLLRVFDEVWKRAREMNAAKVTA